MQMRDRFGRLVTRADLAERRQCGTAITSHFPIAKVPQEIGDALSARLALCDRVEWSLELL